MKRFGGDEEERGKILFLSQQQLHWLRVDVVRLPGLHGHSIRNLLIVEYVVLHVCLERP